MMKDETRKTGVDVIGNIPWGTHICLFYQTAEDLIDILAPYFKTGLDNNEFCIWVTSEPLTVDDAKRALKREIKELDEYIESGQIEFLNYSQWYTASGRFEDDRVLQGWVEKEQQAMKRGWDGLRLTGSAFWLEKEGWGAFADYEAMVDHVIGDYRMIAICTYFLDECDPPEIVDVVSNHQFALIRRGGEWEVIASARRTQAEQALKMQAKVMDSMVEGVSISEKNGIVIYFNSAFEIMFGYTPGELLGNHMSVLFGHAPEENLRRFNDIIVQLRTKGTWFGEISCRKKDGTPFTTYARFNALDTLGEKYWISVQEDITERKRMEEAEREQRALAEALCDSAAALSSTLHLDEVFNRILTNIGRVVPYDTVNVMLIESGVVRIARHQGYAERGLEEFMLTLRFATDEVANLCHMADTGRPLVIPDTQAFPQWVSFPGLDWIRSYAGAPICIKGNVVGFLNLDSVTPGFFTPAHAERLQAFAAQAAVAIENARLFEEVRLGRKRLQTLSCQMVEVQEAERHHIARELHDEIGQALTGLKLTLEISTLSPEETVKTRLDEAKTLIGELMARVRDLSLNLRPGMLDDLGLLPALLWHFERNNTQMGVHVDFKCTMLEGQRFPPEVETAAYRIVQEALTNVARHSGVGLAAVRLWTSLDTLGVQIEDRGIGFDSEAALASGCSSGLVGMYERAALLGGQLTVESTPGAGTRITAQLPLTGHLERRAKER